MAAAEDFDFMKLCALCLNELQMRGITATTSTDFRDGEERMSAMGKSSFTPMFSSDFHDLSKDDAFWLFLQKDGRDIGGVAARVDSLKSESLSDYWLRSYARFYGRSQGPITHTHAPVAIDEIRGSVVYMGEFFMAPAARGSRNTLTLFTHTLFAYCAMKWQPDWLYGFVRKRDIEMGYGGLYGFTRQVPGAQIWDRPPPGRQSEEHLVAISQADMLHMARHYAKRPEGLLGLDSLKRVEKLST